MGSRVHQTWTGSWLRQKHLLSVEDQQSLLFTEHLLCAPATSTHYLHANTPGRASFILQRSKLRLAVVGKLTQHHTGGQWQRKGLNPGCVPSLL